MRTEKGMSTPHENEHTSTHTFTHRKTQTLETQSTCSIIFLWTLKASDALSCDLNCPALQVRSTRHLSSECELACALKYPGDKEFGEIAPLGLRTPLSPKPTTES